MSVCYQYAVSVPNRNSKIVSVFNTVDTDVNVAAAAAAAVVVVVVVVVVEVVVVVVTAILVI